MDASRFDRISKLFARRRFAMAQEATPAATGQPGRAPELLFVQSFRAGAIASKEGAEGRYTLALEGGTGQTIYFSNRPDRIVGADETPDFLERLGFPDDNPPNAALVVETKPGEIDVAVVELFSPVYDAATDEMTYEIEVLANWQAELGVGLQEAPTDLVALEPSFGAAHLFIDSANYCETRPIVCFVTRAVGHKQAEVDIGIIPPDEFGGHCWWDGQCAPCQPSDWFPHWNRVCNERFSRCEGRCFARSSWYVD